MCRSKIDCPTLGDGTASYGTSEGEGSEFSGYDDPDEWGTGVESDGDHWEDDDEDEDGLEEESDDEESSEEGSNEEDQEDSQPAERSTLSHRTNG